MHRSSRAPSLVVLHLPLLCGVSFAAAPENLSPGYVRGDVVSYSYVPIRTWTPREGIGILPYNTPRHPEGEPYSPEMLEYWHRGYVALKKRMFDDVVHNQFADLNPER